MTVRKEVIDTGQYQTIVYHYSHDGRGDPQLNEEMWTEFFRGFRLASRGHDKKAWLREVTAYLADIRSELDSGKFSQFPPQLLERITQEAGGLKCELLSLKLAMQENDADLALECAFCIGRQTERLHVRTTGEQNAMLGKKDRAIRTKGGKKRAQSRRAEWNKWQSDIDRQCRSGLSYESACTNAVSKFGRDLSTIKRRTTNPNPRSSRQKKSAQ
jgi:hypothetical protein